MVHLHFSEILVYMTVCLLSVKLLLNYKPSEDRALCLILCFFFFFFDLISLGVVSVFYSILSKEPEIIDIIPQITG